MKKNLFQSIVMALLAVFTVNVASAQQPHVYINPGHGGYDSDDRNMVIYPFHQGDSAGSWESKSNLRKGLALQDILQKKGYKTSISRVTNTTSDDLALSTIVALCNQSGADVFYSIHSNATGTSSRVNFPMVFYRGYTGSPQIPNADVLAADLEPYLYANQTTVWTGNYQIWGDWSFQPSWGTQGYGVLRGNYAVANLSEGSFHDYIPEAYRLLGLQYCWLEGWNISLGADKYFNRLDNYNLGVISGNVRDDRIKRLQENPQPFLVFGDDNLMPIHNATVRLLDQSGNEVQRTMTDTLRNGIYTFKFVAPGTYTVEVSEPSHFSQTATVTVKANASTYQNFYLKRVRDTAPVVVDYSPVWQDGDPAVKCSVPIVLSFNWDMDSATTCGAFQLDPPVEGTFKWEDSYYRLVFTPVDAFDVNTHYTLTLKKMAEHGGGTPMAEDFTMQFYTQPRNHLTELAVYPYEGAKVHYKTPLVELRVDSLLETYNLFQRLRVLDSEGTELAWNKRSIKYNKRGDDYGFVRIPLVSNLEVGKDYRLVLDVDIADTAGIHLPAERVINFTAVDAGADKPGMEVVEGFEKKEYYLNLGSGGSTTQSPSVELSFVNDRLFGNTSMQLDYDFKTYNPDYRFYLAYNPDWGLEDDQWEKPFYPGQTLGLHVCGDMSYTKMTAEFRTNGDWVKIPICTVDFHGWRYVEVDLSSLPESGGKLRHIFFERTSNVMGQTGTIKLDNLLRGKASGIDEKRLANMDVRHNGDYVVVSADTWVQGVELIDVNGRTVKAAGGNCLNVADVTRGVYFVRVHINGRTATQKVKL
ncbi:MAG: N-acetylmuramoyl-L-alanine amidase [Muribaculaceae bacterium]|nr:N-acetylmuramoyl-L-alanine amidase [Muribaculaceae bacterium]